MGDDSTWSSENDNETIVRTDGILIPGSAEPGDARPFDPSKVIAFPGLPNEQRSGGQGPRIRFRPTRYRVADFPEFDWRVTIESGGSEQVSLSPVDFSANGIALLIPENLIFRVNEVLERLEFLCDNQLLYRGSGCVAALRESDGVTIAGFRLLEGLIDIDRLFEMRSLRSARQTFQSKLDERTSSWFVSESDGFKATVSDFRLFLEDVFYSLRDLTDEFRTDHRGLVVSDAMVETLLAEPISRFCWYFSQIDRLVREVDGYQTESLKQVSRRHLWHFILQGPLFHRSLKKPRKYAGDYITMEHIYHRHFEGSSVFAKYVHLAGCRHDVCQAVRNRAQFIKNEIMKRCSVAPTDGPFRVASIGSGSAEEYMQICTELPSDGRPLHVVLFDADMEALEYCYSRVMKGILDRGLEKTMKLNLLHDSIGHLLYDDSVFRDMGPFDLIVCAGLTDYLSRSKTALLIGKLLGQVRSGGGLLLGNMDPSNPSRWAMEHLAEWNLVYRDKQELAELCQETIGQRSRWSVTSEPLGINNFLVIEAPEHGDSHFG